jgi:para-aminobenzoate synthetase/4-amino-4-deoxychorismate lyase
VFETLLVANGAPVELDAHLARLAASTAALYGQEPPRTAAELVRERARATELGRLRLDVAPDGGGSLAAEAKVVDVEPALVFPPWEGAVELAPVVVPGGIGAHKWADRRLLDEAQADVGAALPLVLDRDGTVLEVSRGNVFLVRDGALVTPAADGRLLPGVARGRVVDVAARAGIAVREEVVSSAALAGAEEVFVTGSVRGVEPVRACEGMREWEPGAVTAAVSAALREVWLAPRRGSG